MRPTITVLLLAILLNACGSIRNLQNVETQIPCLGSIGKSTNTFLTKDFLKAGEPTLSSPLQVSLNVFDFSPASLKKYHKFKELQGKELKDSYADSTQVAATNYYKLRVSDLVGLKAQLNAAENQNLKEYLQDDPDLGVLSGISFVVDENMVPELQRADHFYLKEYRGALMLEAHNGNQISSLKMADFEVFDFETSQLCWKHNKRSKLEIAAIINSGERCPGETEKDPSKLDSTKKYLKL